MANTIALTLIYERSCVSIRTRGACWFCTACSRKSSSRLAMTQVQGPVPAYLSLTVNAAPTGLWLLAFSAFVSLRYPDLVGIIDGTRAPPTPESPTTRRGIYSLGTTARCMVQSNGTMHSRSGCTNGGYFLTSYHFTHPRISPRTEFFSAMKTERNSNRQDCASSLARPEVSAHCP